MYILGIIIIVLLIRMIMNQHTIDEHIHESNNDYSLDDYVCFDGIINNLIFRITVLCKNTKYYLSNKKKSE